MAYFLFSKLSTTLTVDSLESLFKDFEDVFDKCVCVGELSVSVRHVISDCLCMYVCTPASFAGWLAPLQPLAPRATSLQPHPRERSQVWSAQVTPLSLPPLHTVSQYHFKLW